MSRARGGASLCVDAGTTLIKAVVFDDEGREVLAARRPTRIGSPHPGWSEQDMSEVATAVVECMAEAAGRAEATIDRVAITAQGDGAWMLDAAGAPTRPAVLWNDARAGSIVDRWDRDGVLERAFRINGSLGNLGLPHAILRWFLESEPDAVHRTGEVTTCGGWLWRVLTGKTGIHPTDASAPWVDVTTGAYSDELMSLYGLADVRDILPPILARDEQTAALREEIAERTGLRPGTPVTIGPYDVVATALGGGSTSPGAAFCILGTTLCTGAVVEAPSTDGEPSGLTLLGDGGLVVRAFPTLAGTGVLEWVRGILGVADAGALMALAAESAPGAGGTRIWPYLSPAGERAPFLDPRSRGVIGGVTLSTTRADLARAVVESLAHVIRECVDAARTAPTDIVVSGGGAASALWCRTIADVSGITVVRTEGSQIGAKGAALTAAVAAGRFADLAEAADAWVTRADVFTPDPAVRGLFDDRHQDFLGSRAAFAPRWREWADTP